MKIYYNIFIMKIIVKYLLIEILNNLNNLVPRAGKLKLKQINLKPIQLLITLAQINNQNSNLIEI